MNRFLFATAMTVAMLATAQADFGPRPPIKGPLGKTVPVNNVLKYANEFPNHTFWAITDGPTGLALVTMKPDKSKPHPLNLKPLKSAVVYAVPNDVAKLFDTPREFIQAAVAGKLPLAVVASPVLVKEEPVLAGDKRTAIDRVIVVSGGVKTGVTFAEEDPVPPKKGPVLPNKKDPAPEPGPTADTRPAPRLFVVGIAAALALATAGVWLARKAK